jgi:K+/H+ antiporter YhaU regulatory subunit KhtT
MSYASMAANTILNLLKPDELLMLAEGLNIFRVEVHPALVGKSLAESQIRQKTGCSIIAIHDQGEMHINPDPAVRLGENSELIMIGTGEAERLFLQMQSRMNKID